MAVYTILGGKKVAKILKLAFRSTRQAIYSKTGNEHIVATRAALNTLTGTSNADVVAKAIIDIVKNDLSE